MFVVIGISIGSDLLADYLHGASLSHLVLEVAVVGMAVAGGGLFARRWLALRCMTRGVNWLRLPTCKAQRILLL